MPEVKKLNALVEKYVNLAYPLPNGKTVQFLDDDTTYLGNQLESEFGGDRCFGILASMDFYSSAHMKKMESIQNLFYTRKDKKAQTKMICFHPSLSFIFTLLFSRIH